MGTPTRLALAAAMLVIAAFWVKEADWVRYRGQIAESVPPIPALLGGLLLGQTGYGLIASGCAALAPGAVSMMIPSISLEQPDILGLTDSDTTINWGAWALRLAPRLLLLGLTLTLCGILVNAASRKWLLERQPFPIASAVKMLNWQGIKQPLFAAGLASGLLVDCLYAGYQRQGWGMFALSIGCLGLLAPSGPLLTCALTPWLLRLERSQGDQSGGAFSALALLCLLTMKSKDLRLAAFLSLASVLLCKALDYPVWVPTLTAIFSLGYAWARAECGVPLLWAFPYGPDKAKGLFWLIRGPWAAWAAQLGEARYLSVKMSTVALGAVTGLLVAIWCYLSAAGEYSVDMLCGAPEFPNMWLGLSENPLGWSWSFWSAVGGGTVLFLAMLRRNFVSLPLSPTGFALGTVWGGKLSRPFLCAWAVQKATTYLGGVRLLRSVQRLGLGVACGHFLFAGLWSITGIVWPTLTERYFIVFG